MLRINIIIVLLFFISLTFTSGKLDILGEDIERIINLKTPEQVLFSNSTFNQTLADILYWRLDGTSAPPTANWNMGDFGFVNLGQTNMSGELWINNSLRIYNNAGTSAGILFWDEDTNRFVQIASGLQISSTGGAIISSVGSLNISGNPITTTTIRPVTDDLYTLGTNPFRWKEGHFVFINASEINVSSLIVRTNASILGTSFKVNGKEVCLNDSTNCPTNFTNAAYINRIGDIMNQNASLNFSSGKTGSGDSGNGIINLQWISNVSKPIIAWLNETGSEKIWLAGHEYLTNGNLHKHFSIETSNTSGSINTKLEFPFDCNNKTACAIETHDADFIVGGTGDLYVAGGKVGIGIRPDSESPALSIFDGDVLQNSTGTVTYRISRGGGTNFANFVFANKSIDQWTLGLRNDATNNLYIRDNINGFNYLSLMQGSKTVNMSNVTIYSIPGCDTLDTDANGKIICGSDTTFNITYNNLLNQNCPSGFVVNGTLANGTFVCTQAASTDFTNVAYLNNSNTFTLNNIFQNLTTKNITSTNTHTQSIFISDTGYLASAKRFFFDGLGGNVWISYNDDLLPNNLLIANLIDDIFVTSAGAISLQGGSIVGFDGATGINIVSSGGGLEASTELNNRFYSGSGNITFETNNPNMRTQVLGKRFTTNGNVTFSAIPIKASNSTSWYLCIDINGNLFRNETRCR